MVCGSSSLRFTHAAQLLVSRCRHLMSAQRLRCHVVALLHHFTASSLPPPPYLLTFQRLVALNNFIEQVESWGMRLRAVISNLPPRVVHGARCLGHFVSRVLIDGSCWYVNDTRVAPCESLLSLDSDAWQPSPRFPEGVPPPWSYAALCFAPNERVDFSEIRAAFGQPHDPPPLPPEPQPDQRRRRPPSMFSGCLSLAERARLSNLPFHSHGPPCPDSSSQAADPAPCLIILDD